MDGLSKHAAFKLKNVNAPFKAYLAISFTNWAERVLHFSCSTT